MTADAQGPIADATETAVGLSTDEQPLGPLRRRLNWRSPFMIGLAGAPGVAVGGVVVSLVAIPIAAALLPLAREVVFLRLDWT